MQRTSNKRLHALIVPDKANSRSWSLSVSYPVLGLGGFLVLVVLAGVLAAVYHYVDMGLRVVDYKKLLAENHSYRSENFTYRMQTARLGERIDFLETTSRKLMIQSGLEAEGLGGVGGALNHAVSPTKGTLGDVEGYSHKAGELEQRLRAVQRVISERVLVAAATPSILPVRGYVTGKMGYREDPFNGSRDYHAGIDISAPYGSRVVAAADGTVLFAGRKAGYGNIVIIDHKFGMVTRYGHLWKIGVRTGQWVSRNDIVGYVGTSGRSTGPHLHYELWVHHRAVNPLKYIERFGLSD